MYLKILNNFLAKSDPKLWIQLICLWSCLLFTACTSHFVKSDFSYNRLIGKYTKSHKHYKGLYNVFQIHATILNTPIQEAVWEKQKDKLQWNQVTAERNKREALEQIHSQSQFLLAFYTPNAKQNYLDKEKSLWKIYLDFDGQRYEGKVKKEPTPLPLLQELYLHHSRWTKAYIVTFDIPMIHVEKQESHLVIAGLPGQTRLSFPPMKP